MARPRSPITPFPRGWYLVAWSHELEAGQVIRRTYFDQELVVFRGEDGEAHMVNAYCPHLGAHLGHGGTVVGNNIRCPFHGWEYEGKSGACVKIPYADKIPPKAKVRTWPIHEINGLVLTWYHEDGAEPDWFMPELEGVSASEENEGWTPWQENRWTVNAVIQDISENDLDGGHLPYLHQFTDEIPDLKVTPDGPYLKVDTELTTNLDTFGMPGSVAKGPLHTRKYGLSLGYIWHSLDVFGLPIDSRSLGCTTPIDQTSVDIRLIHSVKKTDNEQVNQMLDVHYAKTFREAVEQDISIWEHKAYLTHPVVCKGEGPIMTFRKWSRQFYSDEELKRAGL